MFRLIWRVGIFLSLLFGLSPFAWTAPAAPSAAIHNMPPHPSLEERIKRGEAVTLPRFITDPSFARSKGIDYSPTGPSAMTGTIKALAVVVDFSDKVHTVNASYFDSLIFAAPVAGRGSVRDFYNEVSYGQVDIVTVNLPSALGWKRAPQSYAYYVNGQNCWGAYPNNCQKLAEDIVDAVSSVVDFSQYDNNNDGAMEPIMLIHAGPGAEFTGSANDIWSHSSSLNFPRSYNGVTIGDYVIMPEFWQTVSASTSDMTIGVFAHEMGHGFWNLPDLYDRDNSSEGIGDWSLMAGGSWNGPGVGGSSPAWPDAWTRIQMGFTSSTNVTSSVTGQSIPQAYNNSSTPTVFKLRTSVMGPQEYFLLENRQRVSGSYDEYLPGDGLFIWHVDEAMNTYALQNDKECKVEPHSACAGAHYLVALEQADAARHLENNVNRGNAGDPFPGTALNHSWNMSTHPESSSWYTSASSGIGVANISSSGAVMTADLQISGVSTSFSIYLPLVLKAAPAPGAFNKTAPANGATGQPANPTLSWGASSGATSYEYCIDTSNDNTCNTSWISTAASTGVGLSSLTPAASYYWQVRANNASSATYADGGTWWSFTIASGPSGPTPGYWQSSGGNTNFYVTPNQITVRNFKILVNLGSCGSYWIYRSIPAGDVSILSNQFSFSGSFYASGTFDSSIAAHGTTGLSSFGPICGYYWSGGPWSWSATWQNGSQPSSMRAHAVGSGFMEAAPGTTGDYIAIPVK